MDSIYSQVLGFLHKYFIDCLKSMHALILDSNTVCIKRTSIKYWMGYGSVSFDMDPDPAQIRPKTEKISTFVYFFFMKNIFLRNMICCVIVEIFHDFGLFFATRIRIRFIEADPDPADQNETNSNGSGSATLSILINDTVLTAHIMISVHNEGSQILMATRILFDHKLVTIVTNDISEIKGKRIVRNTLCRFCF